jgi:hypothetical protein
MMDYYLLRSHNHKLPEPDPEEEQAVPEPVIDVVNTYHEKGAAKSMALKVSLRLPLK